MDELRFDDSDKESFGEKTEDEKYFDETQISYEKKYEKRQVKEKVERLRESHVDPKMLRKLYKYFIKPHQTVSQEKINELKSIVTTADNENTIQKFITENPFLLTRGIHPAHHGKVCIPKPKLGNQLEPDFLIAGLDSVGFSWYGVELENPGFAMFTKSGEETKELKHAIRQIED
jgi:hypothetical protein